jgi:glycine betaine/proline transport system substrate-binding protein
VLRRYSPKTLLLLGVLIFALVLASCTGDDDDNGAAEDASPAASYGETITFADLNWASAVIHNRIAQFILEEGYGYETNAIGGTTQPLFQGMETGDVDVTTEIWVDQNPSWEQSVADGNVVDLGINFEDTPQGWYVPTYMVEGDEERGIEPMTPDLQHVDDLPQYKDVFQDPETPDLGRIYIGLPGWDLTEVNQAKLKAYGLDEYYNPFLPGSTPALMTSLITAYEQGEPWLGYLWEPHWITAQLDMTLIQEPEYTDECWEVIYEGEVGCQFPNGTVHVAANADFVENAPEEVIEFLRNYETSTDLTANTMLYMQEQETDEGEAALWFLREHEDVWTEWVPEDVAERVNEALASAR